MRIAIDARWIFQELTGIGTYTQELIRQLAHLDRENEYLLFFQHRHLQERTAEITRFNTAPNFGARLVGYGPFSPRSQILLPGLLTDLKINVFHSTNYMIPLRAFPRHRPGHVRCVVTIHDLIPLLFPDHAPKSRKTRLYPLYRLLMREVAARADIILTVSRSSARDVIEHLRLPAGEADKVLAVPEGVSSRYAPGATHVGDLKTILYVGRFDPYKNVTHLIEAFARVALNDLPNLRLRIVGPEDSRYPEPRQLARTLRVERLITWSGYVEADELKNAYQQADVMVLPSKYEGFGLPVVEAMACGTPVICSNTSSLPEVAGDAAILVPPGDVNALADAIRRVFTEPGLAKDLRARGVQQASRFTWEHAAKETIAAYRRAMERT